MYRFAFLVVFSICIHRSLSSEEHHAFHKAINDLSHMEHHDIKHLEGEEYYKALARKQYKVMFEHFDEDGDESLDRKELRKLGEAMTGNNTDAIEEFLADIMDKDDDKSDSISLEEIGDPQIYMGDSSYGHHHPDHDNQDTREHHYNVHDEF